MAKYYDDQGNEVEGVLSPEEVKEIQEKALKAEELQKAVQEKETELEKLKNKDINFENLRTKTEAEKKELMKGWNEKEKALYGEIEKMQTEREAEKTAKLEDTKAGVLRELAGSDEDLKKALELRVKEFAGEATSPSELAERYRKAYILEKGERPRANPIHAFSPVGNYREPDLSPKNFTDTPQGKESLNKWFPDVAKKIYKD